MKYLDWAATSPSDPEVIDMMAHTAKNYFGNPSSAYQLGSKAKQILDDARNRCARQLGCHPTQVVFTSGGTESNTIAILSLLTSRSPGTILISGMEHPSVAEPVKILSRIGWTIKNIIPDNNGLISPKKLAKMLQSNPETCMISIMGVNNEIGSIQPVREMVESVREDQSRHIHFHADMVQAAGKIPINLEMTGVDSASLSAHKFCGPRGIGLFYHANENFNALIKGGGQEHGIRPGTENVAGAAAMALALEKYATPHESVKTNGDWLLTKLSQLPGACIVPKGRLLPQYKDHYVPGIITVAFPPIPGEVLSRVLAESGFAISTGSACHSNRKSDKKNTFSSLNLTAMETASIIRISIGPHTVRNELEDFLKILTDRVRELNPN